MTYVKYVTKDEVLLAITDWKTGRKEDLRLSIKALPAVRINRSKKLAKVHIERDEEWCPHCQKMLRFYDIVNNSPKYCYCMWCGGAIERRKGNKNGFFDYNLIKDRPPVEDVYPDRPTIGQIKFARSISRELGIPLPEATVNNYWHFINQHQKDYYASIRSKGE